MHTDANRIDWLERNKRNVVSIWDRREKRLKSSELKTFVEFEDVCVGWTVEPCQNQCATWREAVDLAMDMDELSVAIRTLMRGVWCYESGTEEPGRPFVPVVDAINDEDAEWAKGRF